MTKPITRQREYISGRISHEVMAIVIIFTFLAAILNISISPRVPEWHEPDSEYVGHIVSKTVITHWVDSMRGRFGIRDTFGCFSRIQNC